MKYLGLKIQPPRGFFVPSPLEPEVYRLFVKGFWMGSGEIMFMMWGCYSLLCTYINRGQSKVICQ